MKQFELNFETGLLEQFPDFGQCLKSVAYSGKKPFKNIAADLDMSSSRLSRMLNEGEENVHFPAYRLTELIAATGDMRPIYWLVEKYLQDPTTKRNQAIEELAALLPQIQKLVKASASI